MHRLLPIVALLCTAGKGANEFAICLSAKDDSKKWQTPQAAEPESPLAALQPNMP